MNRAWLTLVLLAAARPLFPLSSVHAESVNYDIPNLTGQTVNDYHIILKQPDEIPFTVDTTFTGGGDVAFDPPTIGPAEYYGVPIPGEQMLSFSGATVNPGQTTHVGYHISDPSIEINELKSYWTTDGFDATPQPFLIDPGLFLPGGGFWNVYRVSLFSGPTGNNGVGTMWWEEHGVVQQFVNFTPTPGWASFAVAQFPNEVPLQALNASLPGFGPDSPRQFFAATLLVGDYNHNGVVDAADYVVWRKGLGTTYVPSDYNVWRAHFGQTIGSGSGASVSAAVPEPATLVLLKFAVVGWCLRRGRAA